MIRGTLMEGACIFEGKEKERRPVQYYKRGLLKTIRQQAADV